MAELILAIDAEEFVEQQGISISVEESALHRLETLSPGQPGEADSGRIQIGSVFYDPERQCCRMWYIAYPKFDGNLSFPSRLGYAESPDGIHWHKPELGLVRYNGNYHNNLLSGIPEFCNIESVIRDDDGTYLAALNKISGLTTAMIADPALRVHCESFPMPAFMGIIRSSDGLHWEYEGDVSFPAIREKYETVRLMKFGRQYLLSGQQLPPWCDAQVYGRTVTFFISDDLRHWKKLPGGYQPEPPVQSHIGITAIGEYGHTLLGLSGRFHNAPELPDQFMEVDLVYSRSGLSWRQVAPDRAFWRRGALGSWNCGSVLQAQGCVENGDHMLLYCSGGIMGNSPVGNVITPGYARIRRHRFGFAGLKVGWDIGFQGVRRGSLRTRTLRRSNPEDQLYLNCGNFTGCGVLRAALTDENGNQLASFGLQQSIPVSEDGLAVPLRWRNSPRSLPEQFQLLLEFSGGVFRNESPYLYAIMLQTPQRS